jgi:hypothetical protein
VTTLIHAQGAGSGRCDAKCYNAQFQQCVCVCGGLNHGAGLNAAKDNTTKLAGRMLDQVEKRGGFIAPELQQKELF